MNNQPAYLPRKGDLPRLELVAAAERAIVDSGDPALCSVYFKFTCMWCGERCTLTEPNMLYENGECYSCGKTTKIDMGGFSIHYKIKGHQK